MNESQPENSAKRQKTTEDANESEFNAVLPAEMFALLIGHMDVTERIVCRAVCKYFKQVVDRIKIRSLAIAESEESTCQPVFYAWTSQDYDYVEHLDYKRFSDQFYFVSNEPVYESDVLISPDTCAGLRILTNHFDLGELRKLFVVKVRNGRTMFDLLNRLVQLEHLQVSSIDLDCDLRLQLPNLRILSISQVNGRYDFRISLATENLSHFETGRLRGWQFRFKYPLSVRFLKVREVDDVLYKFRNLEELICVSTSCLIEFDNEKESDDEGYMQATNLASFKRLKRVDCARGAPDDITELQCLCHNSSIDFYYCGLRIDDLCQELDYLLDREGRRDLIKRLGMHHMFDDYEHLADYLYFFEAIRYFKHFVSYFPDRLPENFAHKFYGVRDVNVERKIENVEQFIAFLRCLKCLKTVWLNSTCLDNEFFDRYSHLFGRVHEFHYRHDSFSHPPLEIDFKFILNFKYLENFLTDQPIRMDLITDAFNSLRHLKNFRLENLISIDMNFRIERTKNEFKVLCLDPRKKCPNHQFSSTPEMLKFVEEHFPFLSQQAITN